jgi:hypothetical protein
VAGPQASFLHSPAMLGVLHGRSLNRSGPPLIMVLGLPPLQAGLLQRVLQGGQLLLKARRGFALGVDSRPALLRQIQGRLECWPFPSRDHGQDRPDDRRAGRPPLEVSQICAVLCPPLLRRLPIFTVTALQNLHDLMLQGPELIDFPGPDQASLGLLGLSAHDLNPLPWSPGCSLEGRWGGDHGLGEARQGIAVLLGCLLLLLHPARVACLPPGGLKDRLGQLAQECAGPQQMRGQQAPFSPVHQRSRGASSVTLIDT